MARQKLGYFAETLYPRLFETRYPILMKFLDGFIFCHFEACTDMDCGTNANKGEESNKPEIYIFQKYINNKK